MSFYNKEINQIFDELNSSQNGINQSSAEDRKTKYGENVFETQKKIGFFKNLLNQFKNVMIIILIISAIISIATAIIHHDSESLFEGVLIFVIVFINAVVGVIQEQKAEDALSALKMSTEPFAKVFRDGKLQKLKHHEIVVGDVVEIKAGDIVPADMRISECTNLRCNESSLTGESNPILKTNKVVYVSDCPLAEQENMAFSGTSVTSGNAKGIVVKVGNETEFGKIAKSLVNSKKEKTPLEKNIDKIGKALTISILSIVAVVFLVQILFNKNMSFLDTLLTAVALSVAAIPESLPAVITIIMALGVQKLAKQKAIVKKLSAVETLGCCDVICSDKTGTLTKNEMSVCHIFDGDKLFNERDYNLNKNSSLCKISCFCNNAKIDSNGKILSDATETAIIKFIKNKGIDFEKIKDSNKRIKENEFNSKTKIMSVVCEEGSQKTIYAKGAIDFLIDKCLYCEIDGKITPLTKNIKTKILEQNEKVCSDGERVIAFAYKTINENDEIDELIFAGFMGIIDPPRHEVASVIKNCKKAGLKTIMITGDHPLTALSIAKKLGIANFKSDVITGQELNKLEDKDLTKIIDKYTVFARVTPEHKLKIVNCLKANGHIVAMSGDGINDAPSIKSANIGACMGITGTDVTKEVSDIIIADDNFSTIITSIKEGRTIYKNITKTILFLLSTNIVEVLGIFVTSLVMPSSIFLLPTQILFINLITDSLPAFALGLEPSEPNIMEKPPRDSSKSILSGNIGTSILYQGFVQSLIVLIMFVFATHFYGNEVASTMSFLTICLMQIIHAVNCKTEKSIFKINIFSNHFFNISFCVLLFMILGVYFIPFFSSIFNLTVLTPVQWLVVTLTSLSIIPLVEVGKIFIKEK